MQCQPFRVRLATLARFHALPAVRLVSAKLMSTIQTTESARGVSGRSFSPCSEIRKTSRPNHHANSSKNSPLLGPDLKQGTYKLSC